MFIRENLAHYNVVGVIVPRIFGYVHDKDTIREIMEPGYFNHAKDVLKKNSFIRVVCPDAVGEIIVLEIGNDVIMRDEAIMATPFLDSKPIIEAADHPSSHPKKKKGKPGPKPGRKPGRKPRSELQPEEGPLALTG